MLSDFFTLLHTDTKKIFIQGLTECITDGNTINNQQVERINTSLYKSLQATLRKWFITGSHKFAGFRMQDIRDGNPVEQVLGPDFYLFNTGLIHTFSQGL